MLKNIFLQMVNGSFKSVCRKLLPAESGVLQNWATRSGSSFPGSLPILPERLTETEWRSPTCKAPDNTIPLLWHKYLPQEKDSTLRGTLLLTLAPYSGTRGDLLPVSDGHCRARLARRTAASSKVPTNCISPTSSDTVLRAA